MNIIVEIIVGLKRAPECIKTHHFEGDHAKIFLGRGCATPLGRGIPLAPGEGCPPPQTQPLVGAFVTSIQVPSALNPL